MELDCELSACLRYNKDCGVSVDEVEQVLAVIEGDYDGPDWHWLLKLTGGRFAYLSGGCDYTGWD